MSQKKEGEGDDVLLFLDEHPNASCLLPDKTLRRLLDYYAVYQPLLVALQMGTPQIETQKPSMPMHCLPRVSPAQKTFETRWATSFAEVDALIEAVVQNGHERPILYLHGLVEKDSRTREGLKHRYTNMNYQVLPWSFLKNYKTPQAAKERYRRVVEAIMHYNQHTTDQYGRWYINVSSVRSLLGSARTHDVRTYLKSRQQDLDVHHAQFQLTSSYNRKPYSITESVLISEEPFSNDRTVFPS